MSGLQCFSPRLRRLEIDGRRFEIGPVRLRDLPRFARAATRLLPAILAGDILTVLEDDLAAARDLVASGAGIADPEWLDGIDSGAFIDLLDAVLEVNLDFFVRRTLPGVRRMTARIQEIATIPPQAEAAPEAPTEPPTTGPRTTGPDGAPPSPGSPGAGTGSTRPSA